MVSDYNDKIFENNIKKNWNFPVEFFFVDIQWRSGRGRISGAGDFLAGRSRPRGIRGRETPPVSDADRGIDTWRDHYESLSVYYRFLILPENFIPRFNPFTRLNPIEFLIFNQESTVWERISYKSSKDLNSSTEC